MATVTGSHQTNTALTPPASSQSNYSPWNRAVPVHDENGYSKDQIHNTDNNSSTPFFHSTQQTPAQKMNGLPRPTTSSNKHDSQVTGRERQRNDSRKRSNDSRIDAGRLRKREVGRKRSLNSFTRDVENDDSKWIHRDKLAQIESRELEEAGIQVNRMNTSRSASSKSSTKRQSQPGHHPESTSQNETENFNEGYLEAPPEVESDESNRSQKRPQLQSPRLEQDQETECDTKVFQESTSGPEAAQQTYPVRQHVSKNSTSRIPVSKSSPATASSGIAGGESPASRSRPLSGIWNGTTNDNSLAQSKARRRSQSVGSQNILDRSKERTNTSYRTFSNPSSNQSHSGSGTTIRTTSVRKAAPPRVVIGSKQQSSPTNTSLQDNTRRPATSAGRLTSGHQRPEGDPPWLASMYKPDPRLPPEQQMLPTHAKRMAQEQSVKEGKDGFSFDKESKAIGSGNALKISNYKADEEPFQAEKMAEIKTTNQFPITKTANTSSWPLSGPKNESVTGRATNNGTEHAGYKTIPRIQPSQASLVTPSPAGTPTLRMSPQLEKKEQIPTEDNVEEKRKLCGCCIIM